MTGFPGSPSGPARTLSVKVRLAIGAGAVANDVVANAAVVQRHADDGDWVGQSNDYRFRVVAPARDRRRQYPAYSPTRRTTVSSPGTGRRAAGIRLAGVALALLLTGGGVLLVARFRGVGRT